MDSLHPEEAILLGPSVSMDRRESFSQGRLAAAQAMRELGIENPLPVLRGKDREPLWPDGVLGSITHCGPWSVAVVAKRTPFGALGVDLEDVRRFREDISAQVCTDSELGWIARSRKRLFRAARIFSAKEAVFKALYPLCHCYFEFKDVNLRWSQTARAFRAELRRELASTLVRGMRFNVRSVCCGEFVISFFAQRQQHKLVPGA